MKFIFKILIAIPVLSSLVISVAFIIGGVMQGAKGVIGVVRGQIKTEEYPGLKLFEALESFIFSLLFIIFALGFSKLFMPKSKLSDALEGVMPDWLRKVNFQQLKLILWETLLTTMLAMFIGILLENTENLSWQMTIYPISIALISIAIYLIRMSERNQH
jgi:hypothetical protein